MKVFGMYKKMIALLLFNFCSMKAMNLGEIRKDRDCLLHVLPAELHQELAKYLIWTDHAKRFFLMQAYNYQITELKKELLLPFQQLFQPNIWQKMCGEKGYRCLFDWSFNRAKTVAVANDSMNHDIHVFDIAKNREVQTLKGHTTYINDCALNDDASILVSAGKVENGNASMRVWNTSNGTCLWSIYDNAKEYHQVAISGKGDLIAAAIEARGIGLRDIELFDIKSSIPKEKIHASCWQFLMNQQGNRIYYTENNQIVAWDMEKKEKEWQISERKINIQHAIPLLCASEKGNELAVGYADTTIDIHDMRTGQVKYSLNEPQWGGLDHRGKINRLSFSHDGKLLAVHEKEADRIFIYDLGTRKKLLSLRSQWQAHAALMFSQDDNGLLTAFGRANFCALIDQKYEQYYHYSGKAKFFEACYRILMDKAQNSGATIPIEKNSELYREWQDCDPIMKTVITKNIPEFRS